MKFNEITEYLKQLDAANKYLVFDNFITFRDDIIRLTERDLCHECTMKFFVSFFDDHYWTFNFTLSKDDVLDCESVKIDSLTKADVKNYYNIACNIYHKLVSVQEQRKIQQYIDEIKAI